MGKNNTTNNQTPTYEQMMSLFQETRDIQVNISLRQQEANKRQEEINKRQEESRKSNEEFRKKHEKSMQRLDKLQTLIENNILAEEKRKLENQRREEITEKQLKELGKQIGGLGNSFGKYTEGLLGPSIRKILTEQLGMDSVARNVERLKQKSRLEIDYLGVVNGKVNQAILVEVKSNLQDIHIDQLLEIIKKFKPAFPEYKDKTVFGAIAAVNFTDEQKELILKQGLYFINITNEIANLEIPKNFKPKAY